MQGHERLLKGQCDACVEHSQVLVHQPLGVGALVGDACTPHGRLAQEALTAVLCGGWVGGWVDTVSTVVDVDGSGCDDSSG